MKKTIGIRFGMGEAHTTHKAWLNSVGINKSYAFNFFTSKNIITKFGSLNQLFGFINSLFIPNAELYLLTGLGCLPAVILKKKLFKSKIISINSDTFFSDLKNAGWFKKKYMLWLIKHIDGLISTSNMMKNLAKEFINVPHEVVYPFYDLNKIKNIKINYSNQNICSIATARLSKGGDILKKVFIKYKEKFPNAKLFVLGIGNYSLMLKKEKNIINPEWGDKKKYFPKSGIYINSARIEPFGVNIIESMAVGLPPIVTKNCGAAEIVKKADPFLVTDLNVEEITKKAIKLQKNISLKKKLGKKCKLIASKMTKLDSIHKFKNSFKEIVKLIKDT